MSNSMKLENRTAVVTGAASGIGRALARTLAKRGCHLALADINVPGLEQTVELVATSGLRVSCHQLDVGSASAVADFPGVVLSDHPGVDLLFNNAGVALGGTFEQVSEDEFEWLFAINFRGMVRMTRAFLPLLRDSDDARLIYLSSVFGLIGAPGQTAYAASKFAIRGFAESLRHELEETRIGVTVVHPGGVATSIADNARTPAALSLSPEEKEREQEVWRKALRLAPDDAAETIIRGVENRRARLLVGSDAGVIDMAARLAPISYWKLLQPLLPK